MSFNKIIGTAFLMSVVSYQAQAQEQETYNNGKYFEICVSGFTNDKNNCVRKYYPKNELISLTRFVKEYFGDTNKACPVSFQNPECVVTVAEAKEGEDVGNAIDSSNMKQFCNENLQTPICQVLKASENDSSSDNSNLPIIESNKSLTEQPEWGCAVILCLASPTMPSECRAPVRKLWRHLSRGRPFPKCEGDEGGSTSVKRFYTKHYAKYTKLQVPGWFEGATKCDLKAKVFKVDYRSGTPSTKELEELQSQYEVGTDGWKEFKKSIDAVKALPPYTFSKYFVSEFTFFHTQPRKDSSCVIPRYTFEADEKSIKQTETYLKNRFPRDNETNKSIWGGKR